VPRGSDRPFATAEFPIDGYGLDRLLRPGLRVSGAEHRGHGGGGEPKYQGVSTFKMFGKLTVEVMDACGLVGPWFSAAHAIWISDTDMDLLSRKGAQVSHNGAANLRLGSGIAAVREYIRHGVTVGIGTDGSASSDNQNMFEAMRAAAFVSRVRGLPPADWVSTAEAFTMATEGSARVLGMGDFIGKIAKDYKADLVLLDLDHVKFRAAQQRHQSDRIHRERRRRRQGADRRQARGHRWPCHRHRPRRARDKGAGRGGAPRRAQRRRPTFR
jgi:cytosine/adenosine deaminase-related metal-dependent hydrolase